MNPDEAIAQIDSLLARGNIDSGQAFSYEAFSNMSAGQRASLMAGWTAGIERLTKTGSPYRQQAAEARSKYTGVEAANVDLLAGVLLALRADLEAGYVRDLAALIHAEVFGDFLEMADELLDKQYKDPAAVIVGSVLEEHLRKLAEAAGVDVSTPDGKPRKADTINADLTKAEVYNKIEQKAVTAWLGIRNDAAHGQYQTFTSEQVVLMLAGIRDFMIRHPA